MNFSENVLVTETSYQMLELLSFRSWSGEGSTSFNEKKVLPFLVKNKVQWSFPRRLILENTRKKTLNQISSKKKKVNHSRLRTEFKSFSSESGSMVPPCKVRHQFSVLTLLMRPPTSSLLITSSSVEVKGEYSSACRRISYKRSLQNCHYSECKLTWQWTDNKWSKLDSSLQGKSPKFIVI